MHVAFISDIKQSFLPGFRHMMQPSSSLFGIRTQAYCTESWSLKCQTSSLWVLIIVSIRIHTRDDPLPTLECFAQLLVLNNNDFIYSLFWFRCSDLGWLSIRKAQSRLRFHCQMEKVHQSLLEGTKIDSQVSFSFFSMLYKVINVSDQCFMYLGWWRILNILKMELTSVT